MTWAAQQPYSGQWKHLHQLDTLEKSLQLLAWLKTCLRPTLNAQVTSSRRCQGRPLKSSTPMQKADLCFLTDCGRLENSTQNTSSILLPSPVLASLLSVTKQLVYGPTMTISVPVSTKQGMQSTNSLGRCHFCLHLRRK